jgi:hypothetical protein
MKKLFLILFTSFSFQLYAQASIIGKEWVGENLAYLYIDSLNAFFEIMGHYQEQTRYLIKADTLNLYIKSMVSADLHSIPMEQTRNYNFVIKNLTDSTLALLPIDINAVKLSNNADVLNYRYKKKLQKVKIEFEELKFRFKRSAVSCFCLSMQISKSQELKLIESGILINPGIIQYNYLIVYMLNY